MPIQYTLRDNRLTPDPNDYMAMVTPTRIVELEGVINRMIERGSTVTRADILSVFEDFQMALESLMAEGTNVNLPFGNYSSSIKGVFDGASDNFDPSRHQVLPVVNPGSRLRDCYRVGIAVTKQESSLPTPNLLEYLDINSGERNSLLTKGGMGQIMGHRLKFDLADSQQGIFLIDQKRKETRITTVGENKPSRLMFVLPATLGTGDYELEVRAKINNAFRSGKLIQVLSVS